MDQQQMKQAFINKYGAGGDIRVFHAPGRVNLIGEHIDYNGGYVLPAALEFGTALAIRANTDGWIRLASVNFPELEGQFSVDSIGNERTGKWMDYPLGVMTVLKQTGTQLTSGYDLLFFGNIPNGSGLSSSASIEVVTGYAVLSMEQGHIDTVGIAVLAQQAENEFVGVNCGIMDQFAVANGLKDHAILLMCDTLTYKHVPFRTGQYRIVIGNTNKRRGLVDSKYNERRSQCEAAVTALQPYVDNLNYLAQLTPEQFKLLQEQITDRVVRERARHVIEENARVLLSTQALQDDDLLRFGQLMNDSHESLRDLYEVSCTELDVMVEEARRISGTIGSRMTGAGFGGCTVSLVHEDAVGTFLTEVGAAYEARTGLKADFYVCSAGDGVTEWQSSQNVHI
ncbi:galactokinase [Paenibacillus campi]|uniref:galactokinase n=1 Tax=Paenibacillus campi TaxID=3106031 RepID=UPI002B0005AB|nr:galactokinase [Paenibacillus sp. SGZ-1009]